MNKIFICIPVHNRIEYTLKCIDSIFNQTYKNWHIIISDAGSTDNTTEIIRKKYTNKVTVIQIDASNFWTGGINACVKYAISIANDSDFIYTLNNDTELFRDTLEKLINIATKYKNSIIGSVNLFYRDKTLIEPSSFVIKNKKFRLYKAYHKFGERYDEYNNIIEVDALSGKGVLIPIIVFDKIGTFNSKKLPHYHADTEFTIRAKRNGFKLFLSYQSKLLSHQELSGLGTITSSPNFINFIKSFFSIKSANHLKSRYNYCKLVYERKHILYFILIYVHTIGGYLIRVINFNSKIIKHKIINYGSNKKS